MYLHRPPSPRTVRDVKGRTEHRGFIRKGPIYSEHVRASRNDGQPSGRISPCPRIARRKRGMPGEKSSHGARRAASDAEHRRASRAIRARRTRAPDAVLRHSRADISAGAIPSSRPQAGARAAALCGGRRRRRLRLYPLLPGPRRERASRPQAARGRSPGAGRRLQDRVPQPEQHLPPLTRPDVSELLRSRLRGRRWS